MSLFGHSSHVAILMGLLASPAMAQEQAGGTGLGDIIVTARRTAESMQTVPVAVTALGGEFLEKQNIVDVTSIPQFTPNLSIMQQSTSLTAASVYIRGIGNQEPSSVAEQGVGVYLDGVYVARSAGALFDLVDLERIEVLRGPQGTLFGRNTVGGAIQLVSKKPANDFALDVKAGYGSFNEWFTKARVDTGYIGGSPIKASLSLMHRQRDGYIDNFYTPDSKDPGAVNADAIMVGLQADLGKVTVNYSFDYNDRRGTAPYFQMLYATDDVKNYFGQSASLGGDPFLVSPDRQKHVYQAGFVDNDGNLRYDARAKIQGHSLTIAYEPIDELTLKSITAYRKFNQDTILTLGGNGYLKGVVLDPVTFAPSVGAVTPINGNNAPQRQWQFSQEFQALGNMGDLSYVAGLYYFYEKSSEYNRQNLTFVLPGGQAGLNLAPVQAFGGTAESMAAFGQASWKPAMFDGKLELTGGVRFTGDRKTLTISGDVNPALHGNVDYTNVSWLGSLNYRFTPAIMAYVRASSGYRSGGINPRASVINIFKPEDVKSYEAGIKSEFFNRSVRLNVAVFQTDYSNQQINQFAAGSGGVTSLIVNAGKVRFRGVEGELTVAPVRGLTFDGSLGYTDPTYKTYLYLDPTTNAIINVADEARMPQTAKFNAHVGAQYVVPVSIGELTARVDYAYRSTVYFHNLDRVNPFNVETRSRPDHNLRARLALSDITLGSGKLELGVWGDNLTNQKNLDFAIDFGSLGFAAGSYKKPRTFGVDAKISF
ncbi:TonB-dependent receptor [Sphingobium sp. EM0848]|uniref:TonB-dependent receptor n=1 Tax=Sphingobium sp. EM0848 TaxID=2743473 RepID=UPI0021017DF6|nr:TonB-dependent receptor [Sphingobium sp. EM0848]